VSSLYRGRLLRRLCRQASTTRKTKTTNPRIKSTTAPGLFSHSCPRLLASSLKSMPAVIYNQQHQKWRLSLGNLVQGSIQVAADVRRRTSAAIRDPLRLVRREPNIDAGRIGRTP